MPKRLRSRLKSRLCGHMIDRMDPGLPFNCGGGFRVARDWHWPADALIEAHRAVHQAPAPASAPATNLDEARGLLIAAGRAVD